MVVERKLSREYKRKKRLNTIIGNSWIVIPGVNVLGYLGRTLSGKENILAGSIKTAGAIIYSSIFFSGVFKGDWTLGVDNRYKKEVIDFYDIPDPIGKKDGVASFLEEYKMRKDLEKFSGEDYMHRNEDLSREEYKILFEGNSLDRDN